MRKILMKSFLIFSILVGENSITLSKGKLIIGSKSFTEQYLLSSLATHLLQHHGYSAQERTGMSTQVIREKLLNGKIDLYWEYTGTGYVLLERKNPPTEMDSQQLYQYVRKKDRKNGIVWLAPATLNNSYVLVARQTIAESYQFKDLSGLSRVLNQDIDLKLGLVITFYDRPDGFHSLKTHYGFEVPRNRIQLMSHENIYSALSLGKIDVGLGYNTDPQLRQKSFVALVDDHLFFSPYQPSVVLQADTLNQYPDLEDILESLVLHLDTSTMIHLNYQVDIEKKSIDAVALQWLQQKEILP